jgi:hypothetical protein
LTTSISSRLEWYRYLRDRWEGVCARRFDELEDTARAEFLLLWAGTDVESHEGVPTFSIPVDMIIEDSAALGPASRPLVSQWTRVEEFEHDMSDYLSRGVPHDLGFCGPRLDAACRYMFAKSANLNRSVFRIGRTTGNLLARCDGTRTLEAIEEELSEWATTIDVRGVLKSLGRRGLVGVVRESPPRLIGCAGG